MGGHSYFYFTEYQPDINAALQTLRQREFEAGRYNPVLPFPFDPPDLLEKIRESLPPGLLAFMEAERPTEPPASIEEAIEATGEDGTRSILDIEQISEDPLSHDSLCTTSPLSVDVLNTIFRTTQPSHEMVASILLRDESSSEAVAESSLETASDFWGSIARGTSRYIIIYAEGVPVEIFFAGYSFD